MNKLNIITGIAIVSLLLAAGSTLYIVLNTVEADDPVACAAAGNKMVKHMFGFSCVKAKP